MAGYIQSAVVIKELRSVPLFADSRCVSDADLGALGEKATVLTLKKNARVFEEGTPADACYVLTEGRAKVVISGERGTEIILAILEPYSLVGELSLLDGAARSAALVALEESRFLRIPREAFTELKKRSVMFQELLLSHVASTLRHTNEQLRVICTFQAVGRVAWCLGRLAARDGVLSHGVIALKRPAHHEIAEMTGCSRETVTRALTRLKSKRCVSWDDDTLRLDVEALRRYLRGAMTITLPASHAAASA